MPGPLTPPPLSMCSCLSALCRCTNGCLRSLPYLTLLGFALALSGGSIALAAKGPIRHSLHVVNLSSAAVILDKIWLLFSVMVFVDGVVTVQAFTTAGKARELFYSYAEHWCCCCLQWFVGVGCQIFLFIALVAVFLALLACSYVMATSTMLLLVVRFSCGKGVKALSNVLDVLGTTSGIIAGIGDTVQNEVEGLCRADTITQGIYSLAVGGAMCVLSQVYMIVLAYGNIIKVCHSLEKQHLLDTGADAAYST
mmetsp:Transcript_88628/g.264368  ORF Transcript_88628/g.264368 Transcript_88628/m.264368 type:complete len:253 (-) Transcript_88628:38-796(-)